MRRFYLLLILTFLFSIIIVEASSTFQALVGQITQPPPPPPIPFPVAGIVSLNGVNVEGAKIIVMNLNTGEVENLYTTSDGYLFDMEIVQYSPNDTINITACIRGVECKTELLVIKTQNEPLWLNFGFSTEEAQQEEDIIEELDKEKGKERIEDSLSNSSLQDNSPINGKTNNFGDTIINKINNYFNITNNDYNLVLSLGIGLITLLTVWEINIIFKRKKNIRK